jgi:hypothetical protein
MDSGWMPSLELRELSGRCRLTLGGWAHGEGETLQEAADALVEHLRTVALGFRRGGFSVSRALGRPNMAELSFMWELGEIAASGGDLRERVFGP